MSKIDVAVGLLYPNTCPCRSSDGHELRHGFMDIEQLPSVYGVANTCTTSDHASCGEFPNGTAFQRARTYRAL